MAAACDLRGHPAAPLCAWTAMDVQCSGHDRLGHAHERDHTRDRPMCRRAGVLSAQSERGSPTHRQPSRQRHSMRNSAITVTRPWDSERTPGSATREAQRAGGAGDAATHTGCGIRSRSRNVTRTFHAFVLGSRTERLPTTNRTRIRARRFCQTPERSPAPAFPRWSR